MLFLKRSINSCTFNISNLINLVQKLGKEEHDGFMLWKLLSISLLNRNSLKARKLYTFNFRYKEGKRRELVIYFSSKCIRSYGNYMKHDCFNLESFRRNLFPNDLL